MGTTSAPPRPRTPAPQSKKRLGRGHGSGLHKTAGKGTKGQKARTGTTASPSPGFEGGQTPMQRRLPKRGFNNPFRKETFAINVGDIGDRFQAGGAVDDRRAAGGGPGAALGQAGQGAGRSAGEPR